MAPKKPKKVSIKNLIVLFFAVIGVIAIIYFVYLMFAPIDYENDYYFGDSYYFEDEYSYEELEDICEDPSIAYIEILGEIDEHRRYASEYALTYTKDVVDQLWTADFEDNIKGIVLYIESEGGMLASSEEIAKTVKKMSKPVVALIRNFGLSGGYLVATAADWIIASEFSDVGSIGVIQTIVDESRRNELEGINYINITSGKFKDATLGYRPLTNEEMGILQNDVNYANDLIIKMIAENRGLNIDDLRLISDGRSFMGKQALELGLIDQIGGIMEMEEWIDETLGYQEVWWSECNLSQIWEDWYTNGYEE